MHSDRPASRPGLLRRNALAFHAVTLATFFGASAAPTPLYRLYQQNFALSPLLTTLVFAVYAFALLKALLVAGSISDHLGRRPVIFGAVLLEMAAMILFGLADGAGWLLAARIVQGVATGIAAASIGAALVDADPARGRFVNAIAPLAGMSLGALGTSALVQYAPFPLHLVYGLLFAGFAAEALLLWLTPETGVRRPGALGSLRPRIAVPPQARQTLALITPINIATWTLGGFYLSLVPSVVASVTGNHTPLAGGAVITALTLAGAVAVTVRRKEDPLSNLRTGVGVMAAGLLTVMAGMHAGSVTVLVLGTLVSGTGFGSSFSGSVGLLMPRAEPDERAALLSAFYIQSYLAFSLPAILAGYLARRIGYAATGDIYTIAIISLSLLGLFALLASSRRQARARLP